MRNPIEWLKPIYEAFGVPHPKLSLCVAAALGAVLAGGCWWYAGKLVEKDRQTSNAQSPIVKFHTQVSGDAATSGDKSPAVTGNGNTIEYGQPSPPKKTKH